MKSREIKKFRESYKDYTKDCIFEGYKLAVLFDEKDDVKRLGGRWHPVDTIGDAGGYWWMPAKQLKEDAEPLGGPPNGSLVIDVLNGNKMIMGQYGDFKGPCTGEGTEYSLNILNGPRYTVQWFVDSDAVSFSEHRTDGTFDICDGINTVWFTIEDARTRWDELIAKGYIRVEKS